MHPGGRSTPGVCKTHFNASNGSLVLSHVMLRACLCSSTVLRQAWAPGRWEVPTRCQCGLRLVSPPSCTHQ
jgi:hypothetical protein